jgi:hypothetical protein
MPSFTNKRLVTKLQVGHGICGVGFLSVYVLEGGGGGGGRGEGDKNMLSPLGGTFSQQAAAAAAAAACCIIECKRASSAEQGGGQS